MFESILLGIVGNAGYEALKAGVTSNHADGDADDLARRLFIAVDAASNRFISSNKEKFTRLNDSFLARESNLEVIGKSLHYASPELTPKDLDPRGFSDGADATESEMSSFISLLKEEAAKDRFLDKHFRERKLMSDSAANLEETRQLRALVDRALAMAGQPNKGASSWDQLQVKGSKFPPGWKPKQGELYSGTLQNGSTMRFMISGEILNVEYEFPDGAKWYAEVDEKGNARRMTLAYPIDEYSIFIPESRVLSARHANLDNGHVSHEALLKWGGSVQYILNGDGKLVDYEIKGGAVVKHVERRIEIPERPVTDLN